MTRADLVTLAAAAETKCVQVCVGGLFAQPGNFEQQTGSSQPATRADLVTLAPQPCLESAT